MKGFLYTIEQFFRARDALGGIEVDAEVFNSLLEVITSIKFDRLFEVYMINVESCSIIQFPL